MNVEYIVRLQTDESVLSQSNNALATDRSNVIFRWVGNIYGKCAVN